MRVDSGFRSRYCPGEARNGNIVTMRQVKTLPFEAGRASTAFANVSKWPADGGESTSAESAPKKVSAACWSFSRSRNAAFSKGR